MRRRLYISDIEKRLAMCGMFCELDEEFSILDRVSIGDSANDYYVVWMPEYQSDIGKGCRRVKVYA